MNKASISADIISYTSLSQIDKRQIESDIKKLLIELSERYKNDGFYGRIIQGDYIECALNSGKPALRIALLLKTFIKSIELKENSKSKGIKYFKEHAIRLAVAVAPLTSIDPEKGIIDGEAIYLSGRTIKDYSTSNKQKIVIKNTMFFRCTNSNTEQEFDCIFSLLDTLLSRCSSKQCQVIYLRLLGLSEKDISLRLQKNQSTISQHSTAAGWHAIEKSVKLFEKTIQ
nr:hypothetical protein [uncultured Marinifilum sp.]